MQNIYQKYILIKENIAQNVSSEDVNFHKFNYIQENGKAAYLYEGFNFEDFIHYLYKFLSKELKLETERTNYKNNLIGIKYKAKRSIVKLLKKDVEFLLLFLKTEKVLFFDINTAENINSNNTSQQKINISSFISQSHKKEISSFIYKKIFNSFKKKFPEKVLNFNNSFVEETHNNESLFISNIFKNEQVLAKLNLSLLKKQPKEENSKIYNSSFIVTNKNIAVFGFNKTGECFIFEIIDGKFKYKKAITKISMTYENIVWNSKRSNKKLFSQIKNIQDYDENSRIREFIKNNYLNKNYDFAYFLIKNLIKEEKSPLNGFILLIVSLKNKIENQEDLISQEEITKSLHEILLSKNAEKTIKNIFSNWQLSDTEKIFFLKLFTETAELKQEKKGVIYLYRSIRKDFKKKNKDIISTTFFDIDYAKFLIYADKKRKAIRILNNLLKNLPDETVSDILPSENIDLTGNTSGQLLRIIILELLKKAKGKGFSINETVQFVMLQPLYEPNIQHLAKNGTKELKEKAINALNILNKKGLLSERNIVSVKKYNQLSNTILEQDLRHPATQKNGSFYSIQKWVSKLKTEDYSSLKQFAEQITSANNKKLFEILDNIRHIFNLSKLEFYISKGEKSRGIIGYEGNPPFVIIGHKHLDKESFLFLNFKELQFAVAVEAAHIYYKHSKISASDAWRGVADKESFFLDTLIGSVPVAGIVGKSLKYSQKLRVLSSIIRKTKQAPNVKNIYNTAIKTSKYYTANKELSSKVNKSEKLLLASRLMQFTADRSGLLISGDLKSAVRSVFLTSKQGLEYFEEALEMSLNELLLIKNNDGNYKYQAIALRFSNLFSFYFSDTFDKARKELQKDKE